jgi:hypothetical protein
MYNKNSVICLQSVYMFPLILTINSISQLTFVIEAQNISYKVQIEFLNIIWINLML